MEQKNNPIASQPSKKMISQLLISVSLFSFLVSYSSSLPPKFHHYFSANSFHLLTHALSKNCLFLICNGLLVFLAKSSGLIQPPAAAANHKRIIADALLQTALDRFQLEDRADADPDRDRHHDLDLDLDLAGEKSAKEVSIFIAESEDERGEDSADAEKDGNRPDSASCWLFPDDDVEQLYGYDGEEGEDDEEEEEEEEEAEMMMSTEELNRKFEDFIRKMKEDILVNEARHKVLMLNSPN